MAGDDTRSRIVEAAGPIFAEKGFEATTVREICLAAKVNVAAVNYHFGGKEQLYAEAFRRAQPITSDTIEMPQWPDGTPPEQKLRDFIQVKMMRLIGVGHEPWQGRLLLREMSDSTPAVHGMMKSYVERDFTILVGILQELVPPATPRHRLHQLAATVVSQCVHYRFADKILKLVISEREWAAHYGAGQLAEHISEVCLAALGYGPPVTAQWETESVVPAVGGTEKATSRANQ